MFKHVLTALSLALITSCSSAGPDEQSIEAAVQDYYSRHQPLQVFELTAVQVMKVEQNTPNNFRVEVNCRLKAKDDLPAFVQQTLAQSGQNQAQQQLMTESAYRMQFGNFRRDTVFLYPMRIDLIQQDDHWRVNR